MSVLAESEKKAKMTFHPGIGTLSSALSFVVSLQSIRKYDCKTAILDGAVPLQGTELGWPSIRADRHGLSRHPPPGLLNQRIIACVPAAEC